MALISAINKLARRKKRGGFYQGNDILTFKERECLFIAALIVVFPIFITAVLVILN